MVVRTNGVDNCDDDGISYGDDNCGDASDDDDGGDDGDGDDEGDGDEVMMLIMMITMMLMIIMVMIMMIMIWAISVRWCGS